MSWTYNYPIPLDSTDSIKKRSIIYARSIGSNLYMFADTALKNIQCRRMDVFVFDTKTTEFRTICYDVPEYFGNWITWIEKDGDKIYIWRDCYSTSESLLFEFDTSTDSLIHILSVAARRSYRPSPVIGDNMYAFEYAEDGTLHLLTIDLSKREVVSKTLLTITRSKVRSLSMFKVNNQLFILENISNNERKVYKFANGELSLLSHQHFDDEGDITLLTTCNGELDYRKVTENGTVFYTDRFDMEKLTWSREELKKDDPWSSSDVKRIRTDSAIDGVRYVIKYRLGSEFAEYDLQLFERLPKLSTKCYLNIVNEVIQNDNYTELENVKRMLHPLMSYEVDKMTNWKKREKDIITAENKLKVTQIKAMAKEIIFMEHEHIIDSDMAEAFLDVFDALKIFKIQ